jgi:hypothetical protein
VVGRQKRFLQFLESSENDANVRFDAVGVFRARIDLLNKQSNPFVGEINGFDQRQLSEEPVSKFDEYLVCIRSATRYYRF